MKKLTGRNAIVTGASQGFGLAVAKALLEEGANVAICARNEQQLLQAKAELQQVASGKSRILAIVVDVADAKVVNGFIDKVIAEFGHIDSLISNAGVYGPKGNIEDIDWDEWSQAIDINLKGTVLLTRAVLPHFKQRNYGKIILLSGGGATKPMPYLSAYAASKAAVVRYGETLAEEVRAYNIDVNSIAPGALNTRLLDETLAAGPEKIGQAFYEQCLKQKESGGSPLEKGASLCVYLSSAQSDGITGKLISAIWDPWQRFEEFRSDLQQTDIYTLRRIVPKERGLAWGD